MFKKESPYRSILKGISWRIFATLDTILIVLFFTCWGGSCSIDYAIQIGGVEFFLKLGVYYVHERLWQFIYNKEKVSNRDLLLKTISWRVVATSMTFIIAGFVMHSFSGLALAIAFTELFTKMGFYYLHEKMWQRLPLGKVRRFFKKKKEQWKRI